MSHQPSFAKSGSAASNLNRDFGTDSRTVQGAGVGPWEVPGRVLPGRQGPTLARVVPTRAGRRDSATVTQMQRPLCFDPVTVRQQAVGRVAP
jgi:hypothetical protein